MAPTTRMKKEPPSKSDALTQDDQTISGSEYDPPTNQGPPIRARQNHNNRAIVRIELPAGIESLDRHGYKTSEDEKADDDSTTPASKDYSNYQVTKPAPKRGRRAKKQQEQQHETPEQRIETLQSKVKDLEELYEKEKAKARDLEATRKKLKAKSADKTKEINNRRKNQTELRRECAALKNVIKSGRQETRMLLERVHRIESATDSLDDDYLRDRLKEVRMLWQGLVSESAVTSLERIPKP
jgi:DNA repair exonuclease SbcCD ATPase subunit